ncbi:carboxyl-terminal processing protease [Inhella inkyongensis]|uniref:Carboxyl-terminal processing protease n=1 Tax=Inhella inkyongensis TaxID=392593 RepID=A0A840S056_9BURK|nr:S41 family peptidase [Inhella inkyongensis]MBB5202748.1 carboxyl-terminal processing protease [Inhella inkyongensis]
MLISAWMQRGLRPAFFFGLVSLLAGCAVVPPAPRDAGEREALLQRVWQLIDERHVDPAPPGWGDAPLRHRAAVLGASEADPEALWQALDGLAGERRDAHTRVEGPREVQRKTEDRGPSLGLGLAQLEGQWVIDRVLPDSPAFDAGLRPGDVLLQWQGRSPEDLWAEHLRDARQSSTAQARELSALRRWLDGPLGSTVALRWQNASGAVQEQSLSRRERPTPARWRLELRPSGVGVLQWNRFDVGIEAALVKALRELPPLKGLVLDLRGNGGGNFDMTKRLLDRLLPQSQPIQITQAKGGTDRQTHRAGGTAALYAGPLRVLMDRQSASGAEMLASSLQFHGRARVLGETSCGCLLGIRRHVPLAPQARLAISEMGITLPDGRRIEGQGVEPDRAVPRTLAALRAGRDEVLEAAEAELIAP